MQARRRAGAGEAFRLARWGLGPHAGVRAYRGFKHARPCSMQRTVLAGTSFRSWQASSFNGPCRLCGSMRVRIAYGHNLLCKQRVHAGSPSIHDWWEACTAAAHMFGLGNYFQSVPQTPPAKRHHPHAPARLPVGARGGSLGQHSDSDSDSDSDSEGGLAGRLASTSAGRRQGAQPLHRGAALDTSASSSAPATHACGMTGDGSFRASASQAPGHNAQHAQGDVEGADGIEGKRPLGLSAEERRRQLLYAFSAEPAAIEGARKRKKNKKKNAGQQPGQQHGGT